MTKKTLFQCASLLSLLALLSTACSEAPVGANIVSGETRVTWDKSFTFNFPAPVDTSTVSSSSFFLAQGIVSENMSALAFHRKRISTACDIGNAIEASIVCSSNTSCTLTPSNALAPDTAYSLCLTTSIQYTSPRIGEFFEGSQIDFTTIPIVYSVTPTEATHGTISPATLQSVDRGSSLDFTATPAANYHVLQWLVDGTVVQTGGNTYTLSTITSDHTIEVTFSNQYTVSPSSGAHGNISPSTSQTITIGDSSVFTATPDRGYDIHQWSVDDTVVQTGGSTYTFSNITQDHTVSVDFSQQHYTIGGSVSGLTTSGLVLRNLGGDDLVVGANATTYQFAGTAIFGNAYLITVASQPTHQLCTVSNSSDVNFSNNITNANVTCVQLPIAYVASSGTDELFRCTVSSSNGSLSDCTLISPPDLMSPWSPFATVFATINGTPRAFIADNNGVSIMVCDVDNETGDLSECTSTGSFGGAPTGVAVATIGGTPYAYVGDNVASHLYRCTLHSDGTTNVCNDITPMELSTWDPFTLSFATVNGTQYAYVVDANTRTVFKCTLNETNGNIIACSDLFPSGSPFTILNALTFATVNGTQYAYAPDGISSGAIYRCTLASDGTFSACSAALASPPAWNPRALSFTTVNGTPYAYVGDISGNIYVCAVGITGALNTCTLTPNSGAPPWEPRGVTLHIME